MRFFHSLMRRPSTRSHVLRLVEELRPGARRGRVVRAECGAWMFELDTFGVATVELTEEAAHQVCAACSRTVDRRTA